MKEEEKVGGEKRAQATKRAWAEKPGPIQASEPITTEMTVRAGATVYTLIVLAHLAC